jgi:acyl carrier protein
MSDEVTEGVFAILAEYVEEGKENFKLKTPLDEMGIDSLGLVETIFDLEERFDITIPELDEIDGTATEFKTVGDVVNAVQSLIAEKE